MMVLQALYFFLPAYVAHATPSVVRFVVRKISGTPQTAWWSVFVALALSVVTALIQRGLSFFEYFNDLSLIDYTAYSSVVLGLALGCGVVLADLLVTVYKRKKGVISSLPILEQLIYVVGGTLAIYLISPVAQLISNITFYHLSIILMFTPFLHVMVNILGYMTKLKSMPA